MNRNWVQCFQNLLTECDSSQQRDQEIMLSRTNILKHKTQLCKTFSQLGYCNYGEKCRFAHGNSQLIKLPVNTDLRKRKCKGFWGKGFCNYGVRCKFGHENQNKNQQKSLVLILAKQEFKLQRKSKRSKLIYLLN